jgi:hypothetical protein
MNDLMASMDEQLIDVWAEKRSMLASLLDQITPEDALEVLRVVVRDCEHDAHLGAFLSGSLIGQEQLRQRLRAQELVSGGRSRRSV